MSMDDLRATFFQECEELLEALEFGLIEINEGGGDDDTVNSVFRAVHSIKGGAGAFGLNDLVRFAHKFETTLDEVRAGRLEKSADVLKVFLRSSDVLADLVRAAQEDVDVPCGPVDEVLADLETYLPTPDEEEGDEEDDFQPMGLDFDFDLGSDDDESAEEPVAGPDPYIITFKPQRTLYERGNETVLLFRALADLGSLSVVCDAEALPAFNAMDMGESYLRWTVRLETNAEEGDVREVFEFVEDDCDLTIVHGEAAVEVDPAAPAVEPAPEPEAEPIAATSDPDPVSRFAEEAATPLPETPVEPAAPAPVAKAAEPEAAKAAPKAKAEAPKATVRVELDRVERLINLVGELVINQSVLSQQVFEAGIAANSEVATTLDVFKQLTRDIQEGVMAIRAQPVKSLFQRMSRIVREASAATGKTVRLVTEGEYTEVDKTVVERLSDPLTHMIRNSVDHGLEDPEKRIAAGKDPEGIVNLSAHHRSGRVVIEITDDGAGINRPRVRQIAVEKGLIAEDAVLTDAEIDNLLFMPGFSTATEVSNLSGRGVGMDVVKRAIQSLGGRISIISEPGKGSTFTISLPLTLAVLDGIVVEIGEETTVIPLTNVVETLKPMSDQLHSLGNGTQVVKVRGDFVPVVDVGYELGFRGKTHDLDSKVVLLTESEGGRRSALVIDSIQDQRQVVIKGLEDNYGTVQGVAAATILGDGRIALILDVDALVLGASRSRGDADLSFAMVG